jgi:hypothetical protein
MRVMCLPMAEGKGLGTIAELLAIAEVLAVRGHDVYFLTNPNHVDLVKPFPAFRAEGTLKPRIGPIAPPDCTLGDAALLYGFAGSEYLRQALRSEISAVTRVRPHILLSAVKITAPITASIMNLPLVSLASSTEAPGFESSLYPGHVAPKEACEGANALLHEYGLKGVEDLSELSFTRSAAAIIPTIPTLDPVIGNHPNTTYVGALLPTRLHIWGSTLQPLIPRQDHIVMYLNRGTLTDTYSERLEMALKSAFGAKHSVLNVSARSRVGIGSTYSEIVPLSLVLPRASVLVSGGGRGAMLAAMLHGVPIVAACGEHAERHFNSIGISNEGAGFVITGKDPDPDQIVDCCREIFANRSYEANAHRLGTELRVLGGPLAAVEVIEATANRTSPDG